MPAVMNAANEQAVQAFRDGRLGFLGIADVVERVMATSSGAQQGNRVTLEDVLVADTGARSRAAELIEEDE
jgi:1-deoxy-D-xylulose-5-phosphate reductoisomerase